MKIAVATSGRGTLVRYMLSAIRDGILDATVVSVVTNRECPALELARSETIAHVQCYEIDKFSSRAKRDAKMGEDVAAAGAEFVLVGGYNEVLEVDFLKHFEDRAISVYPTLLPAFGELDESIGPSLEFGVHITGLTVHLRSPLSLSDGPIVAQFPFPVGATDTVESVGSRIASLEREHLPWIIQAFAEDRVRRTGNRVEVLPQGSKA